MAFLNDFKKVDLMKAAIELGEQVHMDMTLKEIKEILQKNDDFEEQYVTRLLKEIIENREKEQEEKERKFQLEQEEKERNFQLEQAKLEIEKMKLANSASGSNAAPTKTQHYDLRNSMPRFNPEDSDISIFLTMFERLAKKIGVENSEYVNLLMTLLPMDVVQLILREPEKSQDDYDHVKNILLKQFKLSPEAFRKKFVSHMMKPDSTWKDFAFELRNYLDEWIKGLDISTYDQLKDLMVTSQIKMNVKPEVREYFVDCWANMKTAEEISTKLEDFENVRGIKAEKQLLNSHAGNLSEEISTKTEDFKNGRGIKVEKNLPNYHAGNLSQPIPRTDYNIPSGNNMYRNQNFQRRGPYGGTSYQENHRRPESARICFSCKKEGHLARYCPTASRLSADAAPFESAKQRNFREYADQSTMQPARPPGNAVTAQVCAEQPHIEMSMPPNDAVIAKVSLRPVTFVDQRKEINLTCEGMKLKGVWDSGADITVVKEELVRDIKGEDNGWGTITSAFGESEMAKLCTFKIKIDDDQHSDIPIVCAVSKKLKCRDMLISTTAYESLKEELRIKNTMTTDNVELVSKAKDNERSPAVVAVSTENNLQDSAANMQDIANIVLEEKCGEDLGWLFESEDVGNEDVLKKRCCVEKAKEVCRVGEANEVCDGEANEGGVGEAKEDCVEEANEGRAEQMNEVSCVDDVNKECRIEEVNEGFVKKVSEVGCVENVNEGCSVEKMNEVSCVDKVNKECYVEEVNEGFVMKVSEAGCVGNVNEGCSVEKMNGNKCAKKVEVSCIGMVNEGCCVQTAKEGCHVGKTEEASVGVDDVKEMVEEPKVMSFSDNVVEDECDGSKSLLSRKVERDVWNEESDKIETSRWLNGESNSGGEVGLSYMKFSGTLSIERKLEIEGKRRKKTINISASAKGANRHNLTYDPGGILWN